MSQPATDRSDSTHRVNPEARRAQNRFLAVKGPAIAAVVAILIALSALAFFCYT